MVNINMCGISLFCGYDSIYSRAFCVFVVFHWCSKKLRVVGAIFAFTTACQQLQVSEQAVLHHLPSPPRLGEQSDL